MTQMRVKPINHYGLKIILWAFLSVPVILTITACGIQETNTYPIELFSEMHYAQSHRAQEPPRLQVPKNAVPFVKLGGVNEVLNIPERQTRLYNPEVAKELFRINCSVCHGQDGNGDGKVSAHLTSDKSYWTVKNGNLYLPPPNLNLIRQDRSEEALFAVITNGIQVMPTFGKMLSEEEIWDLVSYIKDEKTGLGSNQ